MAFVQNRKHPPQAFPGLKKAGNAPSLSPLTALAPAALGLALATPGMVTAQEEQVLSTVNVTDMAAASGYKADSAASSKYTAPLVDTPKTVTVITREVIQETNATSLQEALRTTPGITFGMGEGGNPVGDKPYIRGFDSQANFFIDGLRDPSSQSRDMFAVEQIDVVKGADSAFSGGGAVGGSINLTTKTAHLGNANEATLGVGTDRYARATADFNRQLSDHAALRISLMKQQGDVPGRDDVDIDHQGVNASLALGLGTDTRAVAGVYHYETNDMPDYGIPYNNPVSKYNAYGAGQGGSTATTPPTAAPTLNPNYAKNGNGGPLGVDSSNFYGLKSRDFRKTSVDSASFKIEHDLANGFMLRNATRYTRSQNNYVASNPGDSQFVPGNSTLPRTVKSRNSISTGIINATELLGEIQTGSIKHTLAFGLELSNTETDSRGYVATGPNSMASIANPNPNDSWSGTITRNPQGAKTTNNTRGLYAFDTLTLNRYWLVNLGLRHDDFSTSQRGYSTNGATPTTANLNSDSSFWSYQAGVIFKPRENGSIYLNYATAANPSGISNGDGSDNISVTNKDLEPEKTRSLELGTKWNLLNNQLSLSGALFSMEKTNAKVNVDANTMTTAGKQKINGLELGFAGALTKSWQVFGGYTHMNSELEDPGPSYWTLRSGSWSYTNNAANKGNQFPMTPKDSFSLWTTYKLLPKLTVGGGAYYVSKVYGDAANTKWIPSYTRYDAMANYDLDKNLSLQLNIQNLTDKVYYNQAYTTHMVSVAPARQITLTAKLKF
ncbi:TonB-dependent receptor [Azospira inquinata]|uniref:TonB-dependent siderophore receptor n=1 Tax=Azospira inquinata TaxID=2785627 RepID=A0A975XU22_9RHOO|nr:TonB-dependent siderophore receptor [Azospira inquinata]QWT46339.1 TonB-dependent siderophore receptor [Azospira inquinata]QWT48334.1 TonB-dependent siderophore receptor [Azospira inquinata]